MLGNQLLVLQDSSGQPGEQFARGLRAPAAVLIEADIEQDVLGADHPMRQARRQEFANLVGLFVTTGHRGDPRRRALQHGHQFGLFGHGRNQGDSGRTTADHDDLLSRVIEILRPELRMDHGAGKCFHTGKFGRMPLVVVVVSGARVQEAAAQRARLSALIHCQRPARLGAGPLRRNDFGAVTNMLVDTVTPRGLGDVPQDRGPVGNGFGIAPGLEGISEGEHVRIRADPRIAKKIPGTAHRLARLDNRIGRSG